MSKTLSSPGSSQTESLVYSYTKARGDRVRITGGKYAGQTGTVESNVYQRTVDYPDEWFNGHHVMLDTEVLVTVRWEQVAASEAGPIA